MLRRGRYGCGDPEDELRHVYQSKSAAQRAAASKLSALERAKDTAELTLGGNTAMLAETPLELIGVRDKVDGGWQIVSARHEYSGRGYKVTVSCEASEASGG